MTVIEMATDRNFLMDQAIAVIVADERYDWPESIRGFNQGILDQVELTLTAEEKARLLSRVHAILNKTNPSASTTP